MRVKIHIQIICMLVAGIIGCSENPTDGLKKTANVFDAAEKLVKLVDNHLPAGQSSVRIQGDGLLIVTVSNVFDKVSNNNQVAAEKIAVLIAADVRTFLCTTELKSELEWLVVSFQNREKTNIVFSGTKQLAFFKYELNENELCDTAELVT